MRTKVSSLLEGLGVIALTAGVYEILGAGAALITVGVFAVLAGLAVAQPPRLPRAEDR